MIARRTSSLLLGFALAACAAAPVATLSAAPIATAGPAVADYAALSVGNAWTYEVKTGGSGTANETVRIAGTDGAWLIDDHKGRMKLDALGLRDADRYLLRAPLLPGKSWTSVEQMAVQRFEVVSIDAAVQTRAGLFEKCVVVKNAEPLPPGGQFVTEWTYAPHVGLVALRTRTISAAGKEQEQLRLSLTKFDKGAP